MLTYSLEMFLSCCHGDTCFVIDLKAPQYRAPFISQTCWDSLIFDVVCALTNTHVVQLWEQNVICKQALFSIGSLRARAAHWLTEDHWLPSGLLWRTRVALDCPGLCTLSSCVCKRQPSGPGNGCLITSLANLSWTFREGLNWLLERVMDIVRWCSLWLMFELCFSFTVYWSK